MDYEIHEKTNDNIFEEIEMTKYPDAFDTSSIYSFTPRHPSLLSLRALRDRPGRSCTQSLGQRCGENPPGNDAEGAHEAAGLKIPTTSFVRVKIMQPKLARKHHMRVLFCQPLHLAEGSEN